MRNIQSGDLTVADSGQIEVELNKRPREIDVSFTDTPPTSTCNTPNKDTIECSLVERGRWRKKYWIVVKWTVASVRKAVWKAWE